MDATACRLSVFEPLADRRYRHLFAAQVVALFGTGLTTVALALLAYELAGGDAGAVLGTALALKMVAYVGIAPVIGGIAHKLPRRVMLVGLDLMRAGLVLLLPLIDAVWQIYVVIFLINACSAGFTPLFQATIPDLFADEDQYTQALSLSRLAFELENLVSPILAAGLLLLMHFDVLFVMNAATFLASAALVVSVAIPPGRTPDRAPGIWRNSVYGIRLYMATPRLRGLLALSMAVAAASSMVIVNTVVYVRDRLALGESDVALAIAASGAGSMLAAFAVPGLLRRFHERPVMLTGGMAMGAGLLLGSAHPTFLWLMAVWCLIGTGWSLVQTPAGRLIRRSCSEADRPALFSAQFALSHACWLVGYPLAGYLGSRAGLDAAFLVLAAVAVGGTLASAWLWRRGLQ